MSGPAVEHTETPWLVIADGEGSADTRICRTHAEIVQFLWEQCGHDYTGDEEHARNAWFAWLEDGDNWESRDDVPQFHAETEVGETGRIEIQWMGAACDSHLLALAKARDALLLAESYIREHTDHNGDCELSQSDGDNPCTCDHGFTYTQIKDALLSLPPQTVTK